MIRRAIAITLILSTLSMVGCSVHMHQVGNGASGSNSDQARQWYILFGLVPLNDVDTNAMSAGASDYDVKTEQSFLDIVINIFTGIVTVNSRTVTVTK